MDPNTLTSSDAHSSLVDNAETCVVVESALHEAQSGSIGSTVADAMPRGSVGGPPEEERGDKTDGARRQISAVTRQTEHVSLSRVRRREQCTRHDWWQSEGARDGYRSDASSDARQAYALKQLTSLPGVIGEAIHHAAALRARAVRDGRRPPTADEALAVVNARLNAAVKSRDVPAFLKRPGKTVMLREVFFGEWPGGVIPPDVVLETKVKIDMLLTQMLHHPAWEDVAHCGRGDILVCDALDALEITVEGAPVRVYAAPDLVWVSHEPVILPGFGIPLLPPVVSILDWKTGRTPGQEEHARRQLCVYAWWLTQKLPSLGPKVVPNAYVGRVAAIGAAPGADGDLRFVLGPEDIESGRRLVSDAAAEIVGARGPDGRVPMESTSQQLDACRFCPYTSLCLSGTNTPTVDAVVATERRERGTHCRPVRPLAHGRRNRAAFVYRAE